MGDEIKENLLSQKIWLRFFNMLLVSLLLYTAFLVTWLNMTVQFLFALISGKPNEQLGRLGYSLSIFLSQCVRYLTFYSEEKPFPFSSWPECEKASSTESENPNDVTVDYAGAEGSIEPSAVVQESVDVSNSCDSDEPGVNESSSLQTQASEKIDGSEDVYGSEDVNVSESLDSSEKTDEPESDKLKEEKAP